MDQGLFPVVEESEIAKMDEEIRQLQESVKVQEGECVAMETSTGPHKHAPTHHM